jgi:hypothetical protein
VIFLIHYDRRAGKIKLLKRFIDADRSVAEKARLDLEIALHHQPRDEEVVILEAVSEEQIRKTHGRYFRTVEELIESSGVAR